MPLLRASVTIIGRLYKRRKVKNLEVNVKTKRDDKVDLPPPDRVRRSRRRTAVFYQPLKRLGMLFSYGG